MKHNFWIDKIERMFIPRPTKEEHKRFDMAERTFGFSNEFFSEFMDTIVQEDFITYPSYAEYDSLKDDIARYNEVDRNNVYLSTGSGACIKSLCEITMYPGHNIVSPVPCYPMYGIYGRLFGGNHIGVEYDDSINFNLYKLIDNIDEYTTLVVISNPFSPIGEYKTIDEIRELCIECADREIILLIDEAYVDFSPGTVLPLIEEFDNVVISRTFSKAFGAAGIRVGYLLGSKKLIDIVTKVQLTYPLSNVSVKFASYLLNHWDEVATYSYDTILGRDNLCRILSGGGYDVINSHTNSIHFHESNGDNSETVDIMNNYGLAFKSGDTKTGTPVMVPGDDRKTWIRLSVGPDIDKMNFVGDLV
tara:strand:+ start:1731 stop:2813 length:1083 start_codon:yes stop_codon:yes gene_type:complete